MSEMSFEDQMEKMVNTLKRYQEVTGDKDIIGLSIVDGYPDGVEEKGGVIAVYEECIRRKITWKELLNYHEPPEGVKI